MGKYVITVGPARKAAQVALRARLYEQAGLLKDTLQLIATIDDPQSTVALLHRHPYFAESGVSSVPLGVAVILTTGHCMVYVHPSARQQGWGCKLMQAALGATLVERSRIFARPGNDIRKSADFWRRLEIPCRELDHPLQLSRKEREQLSASARVLMIRRLDEIPLMVLERLYLDGVFSNEYSDEHDSLRGHLYCLIGGEPSPMTHAGFHLRITKGVQEFISLAMIDHQPPSAKIHLYVKPAYRRRGLGHELLSAIRLRFPDTILRGHYTETATTLYQRHGIENLNKTPAHDHQ